MMYCSTWSPLELSTGIQAIAFTKFGAETQQKCACGYRNGISALPTTAGGYDTVADDPFPAALTGVTLNE